MKKIMLLSILSLEIISTHAQWKTSGSDIYYDTGSVAIGINQFLGTEKLRIVGDVNLTGSQIISKTITASAIPAYQSGLSYSIYNKYTINGSATYGYNYNYASDNTLYIQGFGYTINGYQTAGSRSQLYLNNVTLASPQTGHIWSAATNQIVAQTTTASKLVNTLIKSQFVSSSITTYYDLYIATSASSQPTTHWAIYQEDGNAKNYLAGKVGLGATSPTACLHIKAGTASANTAPLKFTSGTLLNTPEAGAIEFNGSHLYFTATNGGTRYQLDQQGSGGTNYWALSGSNISTDTTLSVGIGTSATGPYKLAVEGTIGARKIKVTQVNPWADYVFEDGYRLPTLKEVERYVQKYKHLPDVPSTKEVERDGVDLGDNQAVLLKKIEELTLYIIEMNKTLEKLTDNNNELEKKIKSMER